MANKEGGQFGPLLTAMVTPFKGEGFEAEPDIDGVKILSRSCVDNGTTSAVVAGTTGESPNLTEHDRMAITVAALEAVADRGMVIAGTSTYSTRESVAFSKQAQYDGAHGLLLVTPYYNKPDQDGIFAHFAAIADAVEIPCILYNVPSRTGVNMSAETVLRLDQAYPHIVGLKEAVGTSTPEGRKQVADVIAGKSDGFEEWSGNDQDTLTIMRLGGYGVVSVLSQVGGAGFLISEMIRSHAAGDNEKAQALNDYLMPLFESLFPNDQSKRPSPSAVKSMLNIMGLPGGDLQLPVLEEPETYKNYLRNLLTNYNLIPRASAVFH